MISLMLRLLRGYARRITDVGSRAAARFSATIFGNVRIPLRLAVENYYEIECYDRNGRLKWRETITNLVVNVGLDDILDKYYKGSSYTAAHYVGLTDGTPTVAAGDTMSSHTGWVEVTDYSESVRQTLTLGTVASQSVDNSVSKASYSINGTATVGGAFVSTDNTKSGTTGTLVGVGAFTGGDKAVANGDTLNVTVTCTAAAS